MVNYDKSTIYKLCCKDPEITDIYVGSTTNFTRRKNGHKTICNNENDKKHNLKVYKTIREYGGFDNWDMIEIEKYCATDRKTLHMRERFWLEELGATLNMVIPTQSVAEYRAKNKEQIAEHAAEYRAKNKDKLLQYQVEYYTKNKDKAAKYRAKNKDKFAEYRAKNKDKLLQYQVEYYTKNKEKKLQYQVEYHVKNKEKSNKKSAEYRDKNREQIIEKSKEKVQCECGSEVNRSSLTKHRKSKKHQTWFEQNTTLHLE